MCGWLVKLFLLRSPKSRMGRVAYGVAHRVDRLKALGNGQVPAVVVLAWNTLCEMLFGGE